jgi:soluble lytic murein transglycosylase
MRTALIALAAALLTTLAPRPAPAQTGDAKTGDEIVVAAREALGKRDKARLAALRAAAAPTGHPLTQWVEYFELSNRLTEAPVGEVEAFYAR